jgi:rod shape-determining protein MreC
VYQRRRARILLAVLVLVSLLLITVDFRSGGVEGDGPLGRLRAVASSVLGPIQSGLVTIVSPIGNAIGGITDIFDVRSENVQLRAQLERLQEQRLSYEDVLRQNRELRELLDMRDRGEFETVTALVINHGPSNFEWTVTLDVGSSHGVKRNMPVINGDGLVGRVIQVTADTSRVLLAIDPNFSAATRHARSGEVGILTGNGGEPMLFRPLDPEADVNRGDAIVTALYSNGVFPEGIPVGSVERSDDAAGLLARTIRIRPFVDFTRLSTVLVVLHAPERELPPDSLDPDELEPFQPPDVAPFPGPTSTPTEPASPTESPTGDGA